MSRDDASLAGGTGGDDFQGGAVAFSPTRPGRLSPAELTLYSSGGLESAVRVELREADAEGQPGQLLAVQELTEDAVLKAPGFYPPPRDSCGPLEAVTTCSHVCPAPDRADRVDVASADVRTRLGPCDGGLSAAPGMGNHA